MKTVNLTSIVTKGDKFDLEFAFVENKIGERVEAYLNSYSAPHYTGLQDSFFYRCGEANFDELEKFAKELLDQDRYIDFIYNGIKHDGRFDQLIDAVFAHNEADIPDLRLRVIDSTLKDDCCVADRNTVADCVDIIIDYYREEADD